MDYRQCEYEEYSYDNISVEKLSLGNQIDNLAVSQMGDHYNKIRNKQGNYYKPFENIYHKKCAYCGIITAIQSSASFEIDHFVNGLQERLPDGSNVNHISNLVFSCRNCNQSKKNFHVNQAIDELNPDVRIQNIFTREKDYKIIIKDEFKSNQTIKEFYNKLKFYSSFRKLDYLLLNLFYMKDHSSKEEVKNSLLKLYNELLKLRNEQPSLLR
ncbi:TPA: HNH endonuclease [Streptococcus suis]|uniref:HNH endonuclease n=1 Tax=Streptococcus suis TaxID=1307 RepID=UPI0015536A37|nr:HNH endonuclease [Streptococcus suis]MBS8101530.1 HNH endonuclease [Streptococcus suis]MCK3870382.1 HNH endonuclease [Streptococcus suis]NQK25380.1 HNH endonuclease [Streptococcus suis]NQL17900.1 HNH endonuclease [Streptococcus suis]HEM4146791.1 HNH endonuclease [Streptococcus suis]